MRGDMRHHRGLADRECRVPAAPLSALATAMAWPPAARDTDILISPRAHARTGPIA
jgi:hypothetical protein